MKRLLAYLFIVLGLGLTFSVNAFSKTIFCEVVFINDDGEIVKAGPINWSKKRKSGVIAEAYDVELYIL